VTLHVAAEEGAGNRSRLPLPPLPSQPKFLGTLHHYGGFAYGISPEPPEPAHQVHAVPLDDVWDDDDIFANGVTHPGRRIYRHGSTVQKRGNTMKTEHTISARIDGSPDEKFSELFRSILPSWVETRGIAGNVRRHTELNPDGFVRQTISLRMDEATEDDAEQVAALMKDFEPLASVQIEEKTDLHVYAGAPAEAATA
jgi:hypothetical protein